MGMDRVRKMFRKVVRKMEKIRLSPIEVFVFHAVSDEYDDQLNMRVDWSSTKDFKQRIINYQQRYTFISLEQAYWMMRHDLFRSKKYAVLTCDDGFKSVLKLLPFLEERKVPVTLFVNPCYLDGISKRKEYSLTPQYITHKDLFSIHSENVTIGMHGYEHNDATRISSDQFEESVNKCINMLSNHPRYISFYAYTWGNYSEQTQQILKQKKVVPVFTDGASNYRFHNGIGRKPIDSYYLKKEK